MISKESKNSIKNTNDNNNILDSLRFSQFSGGDSKAINNKPAKICITNNLDNFNFNMPNSNPSA